LGVATLTLQNAPSLFEIVLPRDANPFQDSPTSKPPGGIDTRTPSETSKHPLNDDAHESSKDASDVAQALSSITSFIIGVPVALLGSLVAIYLAYLANEISRLVKDIEVGRDRREVRDDLISRFEEAEKSHKPFYDAYEGLMTAGKLLMDQFVEDIPEFYTPETNYEYHPSVNGAALKLDEHGYPHITAAFSAKSENFFEAALRFDAAVSEFITNSPDAWQKANHFWRQKSSAVKAIDSIPHSEPLSSPATWGALRDLRLAKAIKAGPGSYAASLLFICDAVLRDAIVCDRTIREISLDGETIMLWVEELAQEQARKETEMRFFEVLGLFYLSETPSDRQSILRTRLNLLLLERNPAKRRQAPNKREEPLENNSSAELSGGDWEEQRIHSLEARHARYLKNFKKRDGAINVGFYVLSAIYEALPTEKYMEKLLLEYVESDIAPYFEAETIQGILKMVPKIATRKQSMRSRIADLYTPRNIKPAILSLPELRLTVPFPCEEKLANENHSAEAESILASN
jgi:hypothetical protein